MVRVLGLEAMTPVLSGLFIFGLICLYALGQTRRNFRWTAGPPVLRITCWMGYAVVLTHVGKTGAHRPEYLVSSFVLALALLANTRWAFTSCLEGSRRHITDGQFEEQRSHALAAMLRAMGLVAGAGMMVGIWFVYFLVQTLRGMPVTGQDQMTVILICGLGLAESITALVFGEHMCSRCATPSAGSQAMFSRAVGLAMVVTGWSGLVGSHLLLINLGALLYALAVLSAGSPTSLPVQFHPHVESEEKLRNMWTSVALHHIHDSIDELKEDLRDTRSRLPRETLLQPSDLDEVLQVHAFRVDLGRKIRSLIEPLHGEKLLKRLSDIRRRIADELGFLAEDVSIGQNLQLNPNSYVIKVQDLEVGRGEVYANCFLTVGPEEKLRLLEGELTVDPTYGMPGMWIDEYQRKKAEQLGCMIFDSVSVVATHLTQVIRTHAHQVLGLPEVNKLLANQDPLLVNEVVPAKASLVELRDILRALLEERVSIRNLGTILDQLVSLSKETTTEAKVEIVRCALGAQICKEYQNHEGTINVITLCPQVERTVAEAIETTPEGTFLTIDPNVGQEILQAISNEADDLQQKGLQPILLTSPNIRLPLRKLTRRAFPDLVILSWNEIAPKVNVNSVAMVELN